MGELGFLLICLAVAFGPALFVGTWLTLQVAIELALDKKRNSC